MHVSKNVKLIYERHFSITTKSWKTRTCQPQSWIIYTHSAKENSPVFEEVLSTLSDARLSA